MSSTTTWAIVLYPFVMFALAVCVLNPAKRLVMRYLPEGRIKKVLLFRVN